MTRNWLLAALIFSVALNLGGFRAWAYFAPAQDCPAAASTRSQRLDVTRLGAAVA